MGDGGRQTACDALAILDVGTTSTRAFVMALDGTVLGAAREANRLAAPSPERAEQDPVALRGSAERVVAAAIADGRAAGAEIHGLVVSTQMHSLLVVDAGGTPTGPLITWADTRSEAAATALRARSDALALYARTGCPPHASYPLAKLIALRAAGVGAGAPGPTDRVDDLKSWLLWSWTGRRIVDRSIASGSGLLNVGELRWDAGALELAGVAEEQLPALVDTTDSAPIATVALGLSIGVPIVAGAGDGVLSSLGSGGGGSGTGEDGGGRSNDVDPGRTAVVMIGTSGAVRVASPCPVADRRARLFSYYLAPGRWIVGGALSNGGIVLDWLARTLGIDVADVLAAAAEAPPGAGGLVFVPHLAGERAPGYDALARGTWFGLGLEHDRRHLARAALEGIAFGARAVLAATDETCGPSAGIRATGGLARSPLWPRILAGVADRTVAVPADVEGSTVGALVLGGVALGLLPDLDRGADVVRVGERIRPDPAERATYEAAAGLYDRLDREARSHYPALAALRAASTGTGR